MRYKCEINWDTSYLNVVQSTWYLIFCCINRGYFKEIRSGWIYVWFYTYNVLLYVHKLYPNEVKCYKFQQFTCHKVDLIFFFFASNVKVLIKYSQYLNIVCRFCENLHQLCMVDSVNSFYLHFNVLKHIVRNEKKRSLWLYQRKIHFIRHVPISDCD